MLTGLRDRDRSAVLTTAAIPMRDTPRGHDVIARLAGDEFPALLFAPIDRQDLARHIDQLRCATTTPIYYRDTTPTVAASTGVALVDAVDHRDAFSCPKPPTPRCTPRRSPAPDRPASPLTGRPPTCRSVATTRRLHVSTTRQSVLARQPYGRSYESVTSSAPPGRGAHPPDQSGRGRGAAVAVSAAAPRSSWAMSIAERIWAPVYIQPASVQVRGTICAIAGWGSPQASATSLIV